MHIPEETIDNVLKHLQLVSRQVTSLRATLPKFADLVYRECKAAITKEVITAVLRRAEIHTRLALEFEVLFWRHTSGNYCLVAAVLPDNAKDAKTLLQRQYSSGRESCAYCNLAEGHGYAALELVHAKDAVGRDIPTALVHRQCSLHFTRLLAISLRPEKKESLI